MMKTETYPQTILRGRRGKLIVALMISLPIISLLAGAAVAAVRYGIF